jgi:hypothetical protein
MKSVYYIAIIPTLAGGKVKSWVWNEKANRFIPKEEVARYEEELSVPFSYMPEEYIEIDECLY